MDRQQERTNDQQLPKHDDHYSPTYHYHYSGGDNYYDRVVYYHDHPNSYILGPNPDDDGAPYIIVHDHKHTPAVYINEPANRPHDFGYAE